MPLMIAAAGVDVIPFGVDWPLHQAVGRLSPADLAALEAAFGDLDIRPSREHGVESAVISESWEAATELDLVEIEGAALLARWRVTAACLSGWRSRANGGTAGGGESSGSGREALGYDVGDDLEELGRRRRVPGPYAPLASRKTRRCATGLQPPCGNELQGGDSRQHARLSGRGSSLRSRSRDPLASAEAIARSSDRRVPDLPLGTSRSAADRSARRARRSRAAGRSAGSERTHPCQERAECR